MIKNASGQAVGSQMISATDGSAFTGSVTVAVTVDAGTQATGSVGSGACTHEGNGYHTYAPAQAETNGDLVAFTFTGTGAVPQTVQIYTRALVPDVNVAQISGDSTAADNLESYTDGTTPIPANVTQISGDGTAADNLEAASDGTGYNLGGGSVVAASVTGAVGSVTGAVGSVTGAVGSVTGNVGGNVVGSVGSLATQAKADVNAEVDTALSDIHLDHLLAATYDPASKPGASDALLNELVENDGGVARYTANALEQAPTGGSAPTAAEIADAVWEEALADHEGTVGSTAEALADAGGSGASAADIADAVLDEALSGHTTAGTLGKAIAGIEADATLILEDTGTTLQGELDGIQADTEDIQSRLPAALVSGRIDASVGAMAANTLTAAALAADAVTEMQSGLATASSLSTVDGKIDTIDSNVDAILVDTAEIGVAGAGLTEAGGTGDHLTALATAANLTTVDTVVDAIKLKTDNLPAAPAATGDIPTAAQNADAVWDEATSGHTSSGSYGDKFGAHLPAVLKAVLTSGSTTTAVVLNATTGIDGGAPSSTNDFYNGRVIVFTSGALAGQATDITDYDGSTQTLTVTALTGAPASGVTAVIV